MQNIVWQPPPTDLTLGRDEVHVWRAPLDAPALYLQRLRGTLTADEISRAERFHFQRDRDRFIAGRGLLRAILSRYLDIGPDEMRFGYGPYGKPELISATYTQPFLFNLSHSRDLALFAIALDRRVGVDVEYIRPDVEFDALATSFFSPGEQAVLRALIGRQKQEAFYNGWTRKEAFLKARGDGVAYPLDQFEVSLTPGEPAALLRTREDSQEAARWSLQALTPGPGYVAAVAAEGYGWRVACWEWPNQQLNRNHTGLGYQKRSCYP
jgi:4'-phosphopantetheinyl transferase